MPAPIIALPPLALFALRAAAVGAVIAYVARRRPDGPRDFHRETALNETPDGLELDAEHRPDEARLGAAGRFRRVIRIGRSGPGVEVDAAGLGRVRLRPVRADR